MIANTADSRSMFVGIIIRNCFHAVNQFGTVAVQRKYIRLVRRQLVIYQDLTSSGFIEHCHFHPIAESSQPIHQDDIYIFDKGVTANLIICNVILDILNAAVIPYCHIVQRHMAQSRVFLNASPQCKF